MKIALEEDPLEMKKEGLVASNLEAVLLTFRMLCWAELWNLSWLRGRRMPVAREGGDLLWDSEKGGKIIVSVESMVC